MDPHQSQVEEGLSHEIPVGHGIERVLEPGREPQVGGHPVRVQGQGRPGQGPGPERRDVQSCHRGHQAVDVPGQGPPVGQQVVGQQHRLGPLKVGVTRKIDRARCTGPVQEDVLQVHDLRGQHAQLPLGVEAQIGGHLVVAAPAGVQPGPHISGDLGDPPLDGGVDVLVVGGEDEVRRVQLPFHLVQGGQQLGYFGLVQEATPSEATDVGARSGQVVMGQHPVHVQAGRVGHHGVGRAPAESAVPQGHDGRRSVPRAS